MGRSVEHIRFLLGTVSACMLLALVLLAGCAINNPKSMTLDDVWVIAEKGSNISIEDFSEFENTNRNSTNKLYELGDGYSLNVLTGELGRDIQIITLDYSWDNGFSTCYIYKYGGIKSNIDEFLVRCDSVAKTPLPKLVIEDASPESLSYSLDNQTDIEFAYNISTTLELFKDGTWERLERRDAGSAGAVQDFVLAPHSNSGISTTFWEHTYGVLSDGEYRFTDYVKINYEHGYSSFKIRQEFSLSS